jgi:hypothetical protein
MATNMEDSNFDPDELSPYEKAKYLARKWVMGKDLPELAIKMKEVIGIKERLELEESLNGAWLDVLRFEAIPQKVEAMGLQSPVKLEGIGRISLVTDVRVSVKAGMKEKLYAWLEEHKLADLIQPTIASGTLSAWTKTRMKEGKDYPDDCLNVTALEKASILK